MQAQCATRTRQTLNGAAIVMGENSEALGSSHGTENEGGDCDKNLLAFKSEKVSIPCIAACKPNGICSGLICLGVDLQRTALKTVIGRDADSGWAITTL